MAIGRTVSGDFLQMKYVGKKIASLSGEGQFLVCTGCFLGLILFSNFRLGFCI